jgi:hypothetical protein
MSFVGMRTDIQPLCQRHHIPMLLAELELQVDTAILRKPCYVCVKTDCMSHYDIIHGYFDTTDREGIVRDMMTWTKCPNDGLPMYLSERDMKVGVQVWLCSEVGCDGRCEKRVESAG